MERRGEAFNCAATMTAIIPRAGDSDDVRVRIRALPLGFADELAERMPPPTPPKIRRVSGKNVETRTAWDDSGHQARQRTWNRRVNALLLLEAIDDPELKLSTAKNLEDPTATADAFLAELRESGFSDGDVLVLLDQIDVLSNADAAVQAKARESARDRARKLFKTEG